MRSSKIDGLNIFTEVLNQPISSSTFVLQDELANAEELDVPLIGFSRAEIESALHDLPNNKACLDHISAELLKNGGDEMIKELTNIANIIWHTTKIPDEWKISIITNNNKLI